MKLIGISGLSGSGKDTAYALLAEHYTRQGKITKRISFAKPIKDMCAMMYGWDRERLESDPAYKEGCTLDRGEPDPACVLLGMDRREIMQKIGTEAFRDVIHLDHWIIVTKLAIMRGHYQGVDIGFITDCRFLNELKFVRELGGTLLQVRRGGDKTTLTGHTQHSSEMEWQTWTDWDVVVENAVDPHRSKSENLDRFRDALVQGIERKETA